MAPLLQRRLQHSCSMSKIGTPVVPALGNVYTNFGFFMRAIFLELEEAIWDRQMEIPSDGQSRPVIIIILFVLITACMVATSCCISDVPSQWGGQNFDPPLLPHFSTDLNET